MAKPVEIEILLKDRMSAGLETMQHKLDALMGKASGTGERVRILSTAIAALNAQLSEMKKTAETAVSDLDQSKNISAMEALKSKIKELQEQLRQLDETAENTDTVPAGAAQAGRQYNGLHMSVQQIARELPAATMGLNMFFLAISNNLPVLTDEIKRAKAANEELKASGQSTVPVWRQLISSIFSWQTALMVAITVLSMYGKEIASWVGSLFKSKDALEETRREQERLNKSMADARTSAAKETAGLRVLYAMTQNANASMRDRTAAVKELQSQYPAYFGSLSQEAILAGNASAAYRQLTQDIMSAAYARAYQERLEDLASKNVDELRGSQADYNYMSRNKKAYDDAVAYMNSAQGKADRNQYAFSKTDAHTRAQSGVAIDPEAIERYEKYAKVIDDFETRRERWQRHNENYKRNEATMQSYEDEILKRQSAVEKTTQGASYEQDRKEAEREAERRAKEEERLGKERLKAREDLDKDLLALQRQNQDDETALMQDGTQKKLAEIDNDYKQRIAEIDRQETEFRKKNKEAGLAGLGADGLTDEQADALQKARDNAAKEQEHKTQEVYASEARAMRNYLKEYGTYQQQKLAIAEEYAEKIRNAQNEGERLSLVAGRDRALQQVEINAVRQQVDWGSVFGDFGTMFKEQLQPTIDRLRQIAQSDTFRQTGLEDQKTLYELIDKLEQSNAAWDSDIFKRVSDDIKAYQQAMQDYARAVENAKKAENDYVNAQKAHDAAIRTGNSGLIQATQAAVEETKSAYTAASEQVKTFGTEVQQTTTDLNSSAAQAKSMFESLASGLQGLSSGSLQGIGDGVMQLDRLFSGGELAKNAGNAIAKGFQSLLGEDSKAAQALTEALGDSGLAGEIISAILSILDILAQGGVGGIVSSLADTVLGSVNGILDDIFSGGIITKPLQSVVDGIGGIFDTITFGGFSSWLSSSNAKEVQATIDRLADRNEALRQSIEDLTDTIKGGEGTRSVAAYQQAYDYQAETNRNYLDIAMAQAGYHGSHHSWNYYWGGFSQEQIDRLSEQIGRTWNGDLWDLSPEEMKVLRSNVDMWKQIQDTGKGGYGGRLTEKLDDYIDQAGKLEELEEQLNESLTQISFDSLYDSFIDTLMDMDASAEEIAGNVGEYFMRAILSNQIGEEYKERLQAWYDDFAEAMKDNDLSQDEIGSLTDSYRDIVEEAVALRDKLAEATGYTGDNGSGTTQSGKSGSFDAMSQEQGTKLEGMFTSGLMHWSSMDEKMSDVSEQMGVAVDSLRRIEENTGNSAKHLGEIKEDIKKIIRDGLKMK